MDNTVSLICITKATYINRVQQNTGNGNNDKQKAIKMNGI